MSKPAFYVDRRTKLHGDPILARILALDTLTQAERLNWINNARSALSRKRAELAGAQRNGKYEDLVLEVNLKVLNIYLSCLDDLHARVVDEAEAPDPNQ